VEDDVGTAGADNFSGTSGADDLLGVSDEHLNGIEGVKDGDDAERLGVEDGPEDADGAAGVDDVGGVAGVSDIGRDF